MSLLIAATMLLAQAPDGNLIPNASFEEAKDNQPIGWAQKIWQGKGELHYADISHTGGRSVMITSKAGGDISWRIDVEVQPYSMYRLSGWIKTENIALKDGKGALINIHNLAQVRTDILVGTNDWTYVECVFDVAENDSININCLYGGWGLATGTAWYDDIRLERLSSKNMKPSVTIDVSKTGEPISKYIYGQFIEHLGRCIYGGIWAEMLEDRKFYYAVGAKESPWKPVGEEQAVSMITENAFVGEHTPQIAVSAPNPSGFAQAGLGLVKGKEYVGRIVLAGEPAAGPVEIRLAWGPDAAASQTVRVDALTPDFTTTPLQFTANADTDDGRLEILGLGKGTFEVGTVSLMPADNVDGMRADTLELLKQLDAPIYRWPGGNFVSGYDWRDGIGDPDKRPPRKNPAWKGVEHNDFGIDEFMRFCREINTEPLVVVNSGAGELEMALEELEYATGAADTPMGRMRAKNGHPEPYDVVWWGVGNEMYGAWQIGHMPLDEYVKKHNHFADAMRAKSPGIKLVAVGATGEWSETMLAQCADHMDALSEHFYNGEAKGLMSHVMQIPNSVRNKAESHRRYHETIPALKDKSIPIALDEWNYWYGNHVYGELGTRYYLKDALGIAAGIHEMARNSDVFYMANYAQTVNVIGCIKTTKTDAAFAATGLPLKLYRRHFGVIPVEVTGAPEPLDVAAAWTEDRKAITIGVVNPTREDLPLTLAFEGAKPSGGATVRLITGPDAMAYNEPGEEPKIRIESFPPARPLKETIAIPAISVMLLDVSVE